MKLTLQKCAWPGCTVLGVGPGAQKLYPTAGRLWCRKHVRDQIDWEVERENVVHAIGQGYDFDKAVASGLLAKILKKMNQKQPPKDWRGFIEECAGLAGWALSAGDRRTFVYYFARALWAWELSK